MTAPVALPRDLSEAAFTTWVIELAQLHRWKVQHVRPAHSAKGYRTPVQGHVGAPDLLLARGGEVLCAELKTTAGRLRPAQREWLAALGDHGVVWRPADAAEVLARLARTGTP